MSDGSLSATDDVTVTVRHVNRAPTVNAGDDQTVDERTTVTLSGSGSDPDGDNLSYTWKQLAGPTATLSTTTVASPTFTAPEVTANTDLEFALMVSDGSLSAADTVTVTAATANRAPAFDPAAVTRTVAENSAAGTAVGAPVTATDPDNNVLTYSLAAGDDASSFTIGASTGQLAVGSGVDLDYESGDTELTVSVVASDGTLADTATVTVTVTDADDPGVVTLDAAVARVGTQIAATLKDQDGSKNAGKARRWQRSSDGGSTWSNISGARSRFYTPVAADKDMLLRAVFTYADGHGSGKRAESVAVRVTGPNVAPVFSPAAVALTVAENSAAGTDVGTVTATDGNDDAIAYSFLSGGEASSFAIGETTGVITVGAGATLDYESGDTELSVSVVATDGTLADTAAVTITVTDADDPGVATLDAAQARVGVALTAALADQDEPDANATTVIWQRSGDEGMTWTDIAGATGTSYTPASGDAGKQLRAVFTYTDGHGSGKRAESAAVTVVVSNRSPLFNPATVTRTVEENSATGTAVGAPVTATDPDNDALTYTLAGDDASSFTIGLSTGQLAVGSAADLDYESDDTELTVSVVASDGTLADTATVTVTVTDADDPGVVTLDATVARVGMRIAATLMDQDGSRAAGKTRQWQRSSNGGSTWSDIAGATTRFYTPVAADKDMLLRAVFTYTDGHGPNKRAESDAVRVTGPNVAPVFSPATVTLTVAENSAAGTDVGTVTATDGNEDTLAYSFLSGGDASSFAIAAVTGAITVGTGVVLDYEGGDTELSISVVASDGMLADTAAVTVTVTDADDPGVVTLNAAVARTGMPITATLADEDVPDANATTVKWQSSANDGTTWTDIAGADATSYTPISSDDGNSLRAVFTYTDGHGPNKRAESAAVQVTGANLAPVFSPAAVERTVAENSPVGTAVGAAVTATDGNGDDLSYSFLSGGDASSFAINAETGQMTVGSGAALDYEGGDTELAVSVVASDGTLADTAVVTIAVTNADDPGVVTLDANVARVGTRIAAVLMDQDRSRNAGKKRRWQRSSDGGATWSNISGATTRFYTPVAADEGTLLRAVFTYADGHGPNKRAESAAVAVVGATTPVVSFGAKTYSVAPAGSVNVTVLMSPAAAAPLAVGVTIGGSAPAATRTVTFGVGDTQQTLAVSAAGLSVGDTVLVSFGTLPSGTVAAAPTEARVIVQQTGADIARDKKPALLEAAYAKPSYTAVAGDGGVEVAVRLSPAADREVIVPVTATGAASAGLDALGVPESVRFAPGDSVAAFTVEAPAGTSARAITLGFGDLPERVSAGAVASSVIDVVDAGANAARFGESMEVGLAVLGRSVAEGARQAVGGRIEAAMRGGRDSGNASSGGGSVEEWAGRAVGTLASLAGSPTGPDRTRHAYRRPAGGEALERLLPQVSFSADIGGGEQGSAPRFSVWGEGSAQGFRGEPGGISYDGGLRALTVGADARLGTGAGVGLSVMRSGGEFDYTSASLEGSLDHAMTTVHPYLFFQPTPGLGLWAMAGYGTGQTRDGECDARDGRHAPHGIRRRQAAARAARCIRAQSRQRRVRRTHERGRRRSRRGGDARARARRGDLCSEWTQGRRRGGRTL
ncbi:MAG: cadherin domain-containing protein [Gemmatimonadota bacterium]|nr:cadherin domain-containing protein [Gemmatimonadota bacterium]